MQQDTDIFIIGGGINGTAIAADAAGRGLQVTLCDKADLAAGTSSASSKLIHGGLRYLELYEFSLVKKALREREILMQRAPNLIQPLEFVLPYEKHLRPAWMIRLGLFFYDYLAKRRYLPHSKAISLNNDIHGAGLRSHLKKGFSYFDCFTDDARLVISNAKLAHQHHATILTYTEFLSAEYENQQWKIKLKNTFSDEVFYHYAKVLVNVAGPWVNQVNSRITHTTTTFDIELVKGSHFIVPTLYAGEFAYLLQNKDQRIVFAIPYLKQFTLIGTTDILYSGDLNHIEISSDEKKYLCDIIHDYFKKTVHENDIVWSYSGVRCLRHTSDNPSDATRNYQLILDPKTPLLTVIGGKLTTHRLLAEDALVQLRHYFPIMKPAWTANCPLPGCDFDGRSFNSFLKIFKNHYPWLPADLAERYVQSYGALAYTLLNDAATLDDLGTHYGHGLYQNEIDYLMTHEWAKTVDDILWRRTKLGLFFLPHEIEYLQSKLFGI